MLKITKKNSIHHERDGVNAYYYQMPDINNGTTFAYAEFKSEHGERKIGGRSRIYYILEGEGEFVINGKKFTVSAGDIVPIPEYGTYNLWPEKGKTLKVILYMELLDISKLPK